MEQAGLRTAERKVAVAPALQLVQLAVAGAVHRLQAELPLLVERREDVLLVLAPVARRLPELRLVELRSLDPDVAALGLHLAVERNELVEEDRALRQPERGARRDRVPIEQL